MRSGYELVMLTLQLLAWLTSGIDFVADLRAEMAIDGELCCLGTMGSTENGAWGSDAGGTMGSTENGAWGSDAGGSLFEVAENPI
ncbi:hypothetical protein OIU74_023941 [Salix koriyanagi]|uniref:Secreted protein n=1 Tax=Salix koriyanagi TaxID=2511006 RepID=A0A9Q0WDE6_9ROSI|nr:hypothetical protein OIU74_023941 [Salix koriyanagi]